MNSANSAFSSAVFISKKRMLIVGGGQFAIFVIFAPRISFNNLRENLHSPKKFKPSYKSMVEYILTWRIKHTYNILLNTVLISSPKFLFLIH